MSRMDIFHIPAFSDSKKAMERFKLVVKGGGSDQWASRSSILHLSINSARFISFIARLALG